MYSSEEGGTVQLVHKESCISIKIVNVKVQCVIYVCSDANNNKVTVTRSSLYRTPLNTGQHLVHLC